MEYSLFALLFTNSFLPTPTPYILHNTDAYYSGKGGAWVRVQVTLLTILQFLTTGWISFSFVASFDSSTREPAGLLPVSVSLFSNFHQLFACSLQLVSETITLACCCEDGFGSCLIQSVITFMIKPIIFVSCYAAVRFC